MSFPPFRPLARHGNNHDAKRRYGRGFDQIIPGNWAVKAQLSVEFALAFATVLNEWLQQLLRSFKEVVSIYNRKDV